MDVISVHRYPYWHRHRYLIWGLVSSLLLAFIPFVVHISNPENLYIIAVVFFALHCVMDVNIRKKSQTITLTREGLKVGKELIPFSSVKYIHYQGVRTSGEILSQENIIIIYGENKKLEISPRISGFEEMKKQFSKHGIASNMY